MADHNSLDGALSRHTNEHRIVRQLPAVIQYARRLATYEAVLGWLLLVCWLIWWISNLIHGRTADGGLTWIHPSFGVDFANHVDKGVRTWMVGGDPYAERHLLYPYPPIVLRLFAWVWLTSTDVSVRIWMSCAALFAVIGALAAIHTRRQLGLATISASLAISAVLFSFPVLFALDRANYDLLIVPLVVCAVGLMRRNTATADVIAGLLLAIAIWSKLYPGLLVLGMFALRRWRLAIWLALFGLLIGLADPPQLMRFLANNKIQMDTAWALARAFPTLLPWNHPLPPGWQSLWAGTPLAFLPGELGTALLLGVPLVWVSYDVYRCSHPDRLCMPYLLWLVALGSFVPPVANDYSLTPLVLAVLMIWNREDRWFVHAAFAALILWWQPLALPLPGRVYLFIKLAALMAVGQSLVAHAAKLSNIDSSSWKLRPAWAKASNVNAAI
jgi:hypothetical protein